MSTFESDRQHVARLQALQCRESVQAFLQKASPELPEEVGEWLAHLSLLYYVPFNHLVMDQRMLPEESIRFFYVDVNWIDSLVDGALSVGTHSSRDEAYHRAMQAVIRQSADRSVQQARSRLRGVAGPEDDGSIDWMSGMLLRSALVSGWPGLEVRAFEGQSTKTEPIELLRMDRLAPDLLLCLFAKIPQLIAIQEPPQGLSFGVMGKEKTVYLRGLGGVYPPGKQIEKPEAEATVVMRDGGGKRVLDVTETHKALETALKNKKLDPQALADNETLGPGGMALQMVKLAGQAHFKQAEAVVEGLALDQAAPAAVAAPVAPAYDEQDILNDLFQR